MRIRLWPRGWVSPAFAWSCLRIQLCECQRMQLAAGVPQPEPQPIPVRIIRQASVYDADSWTRAGERLAADFAQFLAGWDAYVMSAADSLCSEAAAYLASVT